MRHLDRVNARPVERGGDRADMIQPIGMADRMHAVAQRHILDVERRLARVEGHAACRSSRRRAIASPVASAAEVMMSRLPA